MAEDLGVRRLVVDAELLARLGPGSPRSAWERDLRRTGLLQLEPPDGPVGEALSELQSTIGAWPRPVGERVDPEGSLLAVVGHRWAAGYAVALGIGLLWSLTAGDLRALFLSIIGVVLVAWGRDRLGQAHAGSPDEAWYGERAALLLRRILARSFVAAAGEVVVENTPHVDYLRSRIDLLDSAVRVVDGRIEEFDQTLRHVRLANQRMGRAEDDVETDRLKEALDREQLTRTQIVLVRESVEQRLTEVLDRIDQLRASADRQALSERVQRMAAGDHPVARHIAEIEVDVAEVESAIRGLALEAREADARTTALLEVLGAGRTWSPSRSSAKVRDSERA